MSNYRDLSWHPIKKKVMEASWLDDYFGKHKYGVRFDDEYHVFKPEEVELPISEFYKDRSCLKS